MQAVRSSATSCKQHTPFVIKPLQRGIMLALLGVAIAAPINLLAVTPAQADAQQQIHTFTLPAGSLESALAAFSAQSGINVSFTPDVVQGKSATGLSGQYHADEALNRMLAGSGLQANRLANGGYSLQAMRVVDGSEVVELSAVEVSGMAIDESAWGR
ncbi:STN domain-containing protein [Nitrincola sp. A-D6]|uniref:STN domain-containing protein n=1 Tax=Nitrincola sp. A-D6 TaxID=1545442 RepID=UPI00068D9911|nr:STN domain-containing protein [Nitrincola sp. A-D6]